MSYRRTPFAIDEYFHCFNRGIDKRITFEEDAHYRRFMQLLYLANDTKSLQRPLFEHVSYAETFTLPRKSPLVAIGAFCLMPNHIHLLMKEIVEHGISRFMHKIGTGYALYFNNLHDRVGNLFIKPFRSKHISDDRYMHRAVDYVHMNPCELFEPKWKSGFVKNMQRLERKIRAYPYASFPDYSGMVRPEHAILDPEQVDLIRSYQVPVQKMLSDARAYYGEVSPMIENLK
ncbi:hypothetical protein A3H16_03410 [Candidatus Kaiserbacteria bacterium RIFCSPLOWO2_12_FULL_53_8]|uniref:Transposase IS200-like domain-containing protein n=2 Tax=Candidatus Kaiseribacteriota TaxID=1752734 RepID=A0A1F6CUP2_9BACT|nr:MAG: hypothetical protein A2851_04330 [Candidatus Kaiserbacteria bacterium RIFCSPHIGHO2_01_FULL_53_29]OGG91503.1 MAG: hypothetical protein A3H16_03410 [Candidatus Kaiserbacteria bacterium RIFCSPLOWO2_12_FULL_53_8]